MAVLQAPALRPALPGLATATWTSNDITQPYDAKLLPDAVRRDFCVPDVSQQEKNLVIFNTGHRPEGKLMRAATCSD
jgi:hypothetical protein